MKTYQVNMPRKLGLEPGRKYFFHETNNGYILSLSGGNWIGMPKNIIENNPRLYTEKKKGGEQ